MPRLALRLLSPTPAELGRLGERLAARHLARTGARVRARRIRVRGVEIDLLAREGRRLVLCEVKAARIAADVRLADLRYRPGVRLDRDRLDRLERAARAISREGRPAARIDLIEVLAARNGRRLEIGHHVDLRKPLRPGALPEGTLRPSGGLGTREAQAARGSPAEK